MYTTQMRELTDGVLHPPQQHEQLDAAKAYARIRTSEKRSEITVRNQSGATVATYEDGQEVTTEKPRLVTKTSKELIEGK